MALLVALVVACSSTGDDVSVSSEAETIDVASSESASGGDGTGGAASRATSPEDRAVTLRTTACGDASKTTGSGVIVGRAVVLTAAHVVVGATDVFVDGADEPAVVAVLDRTRDLAWLDVPSVDATPVELAQVQAGDAVRVVGGATSGTVDALVERVLAMTVDDVRSTTRSTRSGFQLDAAIDGGDSGAGVFDGDGRLVGIVFAVPSEGSDATFAVDATEVAAVLASTAVGERRCDPSRSQLADPPN